MAKTSRRKKTSRRPRRARRTSRPARRRLKGLVVYKTRRGKLWKTGRIPAGLTLRSWRKTHKGARVLGHAISYRAQQKLLKRLLKKSATRTRRRSRR
jgi:hypothetical protein